MMKTFGYARGPYIYYIVQMSDVVCNGVNPLTGLDDVLNLNFARGLGQSEITPLVR